VAHRVVNLGVRAVHRATDTVGVCGGVGHAERVACSLPEAVESAPLWASGECLCMQPGPGRGGDSERRITGGAKWSFIGCSLRSYHDVAFHRVRPMELPFSIRKKGTLKIQILDFEYGADFAVPRRCFSGSKRAIMFDSIPSSVWPLLISS